jgi:hypothetical protein
MLIAAHLLLGLLGAVLCIPLSSALEALGPAGLIPLLHILLSACVV